MSRGIGVQQTHCRQVRKVSRVRHGGPGVFIVIAISRSVRATTMAHQVMSFKSFGIDEMLFTKYLGCHQEEIGSWIPSC
jgi:hypothetical protein